MRTSPRHLRGGRAKPSPQALAPRRGGRRGLRERSRRAGEGLRGSPRLSNRLPPDPAAAPGPVYPFIFPLGGHSEGVSRGKTLRLWASRPAPLRRGRQAPSLPAGPPRRSRPGAAQAAAGRASPRLPRTTRPLGAGAGRRGLREGPLGGGGWGGGKGGAGAALISPPPPALPASAPLRRGRRLGARGGRRRRRRHRAPAAARPHLLGDPRLQLAPQLGPGQAVEVVELAQDQQRAALRVRFPGAGLELQLHVRHLPAPPRPGPARLSPARPHGSAPAPAPAPRGGHHGGAGGPRRPRRAPQAGKAPGRAGRRDPDAAGGARGERDGPSAPCCGPLTAPAPSAPRLGRVGIPRTTRGSSRPEKAPGARPFVFDPRLGGQAGDQGCYSFTSYRGKWGEKRHQTKKTTR